MRERRVRRETSKKAIAADRVAQPCAAGSAALYLPLSAKGYSPERSKRPASADQVDDQDDHSDDEKEVDQAAGDVEAETQDPQNQQNYKDSPEHSRSPYFE